jgi:RNA polymerase sigma-70 factor (ECF subfamily)
MDAPEPVRWHDPEAVAACVQSYRPRLLAFIEHRMRPGLRQRLDPDDIVQEVSLAAVRPAGTTDAPAASERDPFGWLCHVAEQRIIDAHRRHRVAANRSVDREVSLPAGGTGDRSAADVVAGIADRELTPAAAATWHELERRFAAAVEQLEEDDRQIV